MNSKQILLLQLRTLITVGLSNNLRTLQEEMVESLPPPTEAKKGRLQGQYTNWAEYGAGLGKYTPSNTDYCTQSPGRHRSKINRAPYNLLIRPFEWNDIKEWRKDWPEPHYMLDVIRNAHSWARVSASAGMQF